MPRADVEDQIPKLADRLRASIENATEQFLLARIDLWDLPPRFWVTLGELRGAVRWNAMAQDLCRTVGNAALVLGSPGDFAGVCGESLREVYDVANELSRLLHRRTPRN